MRADDALRRLGKKIYISTRSSATEDFWKNFRYKTYEFGEFYCDSEWTRKTSDGSKDHKTQSEASDTEALDNFLSQFKIISEEE